MPSAFTKAKSSAEWARDRRTQPCDAGRPSAATCPVPWMAWPISVKKIELGMGASSHSREKWSRSIRNGV